MPNDVERLLLQVDASIDIAKRNLRELSNVVDNETANWDRSLKRGEASIARTGKALQSVGQFRGGMQQLSFQIGDVSQQIALGTKASTIFAQQSGQVIQALMLMNTGSSGFLKFLAGPWGVVLTTAGIVLASFAGKLFETRDEVGKLVDKMRDQATQAHNQEVANKVWEKSIDGVREAQKKLRDEFEKSIKTEEIVRQQNLDKASSGLETQKASIPGAEKAVRDAEKAVAAQRPFTEAARNARGEGSDALIATSEVKLAGLETKLKEARDNLAQLRRDIQASETTVREAQVAIANAQADASSSASSAIDSQLKSVQARLTIAGDIGKITSDALQDARTAWNAYAKAEEAAAQEGVNFAKVGTNKEILDLTRKFASGRMDVVAYAAAMKQATTALNNAAKAARDAKKSTGELSTFIMPVQGTITSGFGPRTPPTKGASSFHPAIDIAAPLGTPVKAAAGGVVIYAGKMPGLGNVVIVDHGGGTITEYGHLSKILTQKGASVGQSDVIAQVGSTGISTGPHLDYRVKVGGKYVDPRKGSFPVDSVAAGMKAGAAAARLEDHTTDQNDEFASQMARLDDQLLTARAELATGLQAQADFAEKQVDIDQQRYELSLQNAVDDGKLRQEQADLLKTKSEAVATQKKSNIEARKLLEHQEAEQRLADQENGFRVDALRYADSIARTQQEHRRIQLEIIDLLYKQKEADLRLAKAKALQAKDAEEAARIQSEIDELPAQRARETDSADRGTRDPLQQWADSVPKTAAEVNEALQSIEANGFDALADGIAGVISGTQSLGDAFRGIAQQIIADIARMIARMIIMRALMSVMGGIGSPGGGGAALDMSTSPVASGTSVIDPGLFAAPLASGGFVSGPGTSTSDSIPAMLSNGEYVMNANAVSRFGLPFLEAINTGRMPHAKGGGLLGMLGGAAFGIFRGGGLGDFALPGSGAWLAKKLGPFGLLGKAFHFADGGPVTMPRGPMVSIPRPDFGMMRASGDNHYHISVIAPNTGDSIRDHSTALQTATTLRRELARASETNR